MVQVSIMEEAGQDVPNWLRGEADRFKNHQVDITLELRLTMLLAWHYHPGNAVKAT